MNLRKIKLALTIKLINSNYRKSSALIAVKELMKEFKEDVGAFLGFKELKRSNLDRQHTRSIYSIQFENCTLHLDLVMNIFTKNQYISGFQLR